MEDIMLRIDSVSKQYRLGQIGGTTLYEELQRLGARLRHREDPTRRIGSRDYADGETFMALEGVSFDVMRGERIGIIGHNGAGKSTLLKLISRVTAPTSGTISLNGRVASMLEVGTGFHQELTGRENVYMNGAILGMTKREIDAKMEDIIEFSECRQFIDTPVKRYSSGMYVKLAFSVAAHLDSEIMIMDEVLAVGDMAFQRKCLDKMYDVSKRSERTILYVSHNMDTIRRLCDRVIVLDRGKVVDDGSVEEGIAAYLGQRGQLKNSNEFTQPREGNFGIDFRFNRMSFLYTTLPIYYSNEPIRIAFDISTKKSLSDVYIRMIFKSSMGAIAGMSTSERISNLEEGASSLSVSVAHECLAPGKYYVRLVAFASNDIGPGSLLDVIEDAFSFETIEEPECQTGWKTSLWGFAKLPQIEINSMG